MCFDDGIDRTRFFAEAAKNTLRQIDVLTSGAARVVCSLFGLNGDGERRADGFTQLTRDTTFLAVFITAQRVQAAKPGALWRLFFGKLHRNLALEQMPSGQFQAL